MSFGEVEIRRQKRVADVEYLKTGGGAEPGDLSRIFGSRVSESRLSTGPPLKPELRFGDSSDCPRLYGKLQGGQK